MPTPPPALSQVLCQALMAFVRSLLVSRLSRRHPTDYVRPCLGPLPASPNISCNPLAPSESLDQAAKEYHTYLPTYLGSIERWTWRKLCLLHQLPSSSSRAEHDSEPGLYLHLANEIMDYCTTAPGWLRQRFMATIICQDSIQLDPICAVTTGFLQRMDEWMVKRMRVHRICNSVLPASATCRHIPLPNASHLNYEIRCNGPEVGAATHTYGCAVR
ncbi:hypothetical protein LY76DRAFT_42622 [Colletotrichum caudatum]|nr:hypothetical protein LY76DRAFT_42622 [Colletotrichum caudatum]